MSIYDIDYMLFAIEQLPPDKRFLTNVAYLQALISPLQYDRDLLLDSYRAGSAALPYKGPDQQPAGYSSGARVVYKNSVYESLVDNNTQSPLIVSAWKPVQDIYIGVTERLKYNGQTIVLEYALNRWFNTTFRQPNAAGVKSDIYLTTNPKQISCFISGGDENNSSISYANASTEYSLDYYSNQDFFNLTVNFPLSVYTQLSVNDNGRNGIIKNFVDRYVYAGITYNISTY